MGLAPGASRVVPYAAGGNREVRTMPRKYFSSVPMALVIFILCIACGFLLGMKSFMPPPVASM